MYMVWVTCNVAETTVTGIDLRINNLTGSLPANLAGLPNLVDFYAYSNKLTGPIPVLAGLTKLERFLVRETS